MKLFVEGEELGDDYGIEIRISPKLGGKRRLSAWLQRADPEFGLTQTIRSIRGELRIEHDGEELQVES